MCFPLNSFFFPQGSQTAREGETPPSTAGTSSIGWQGHQGGVGVFGLSLSAVHRLVSGSGVFKVLGCWDVV